MSVLLPNLFYVFICLINTLRAGLRYIHTWISAWKTAVPPPAAPLPIALESCSRAQTDRPV